METSYAGPFRQSATIVTSDPLHPEITLTIKGEYTTPLYADPDELTFGEIAGTEPVTREARIFCILPDQQVKIQGHRMADRGLEEFFQVEDAPLGESESSVKSEGCDEWSPGPRYGETGVASRPVSTRQSP